MKPEFSIVPERERVAPPPRYSFSPKVRKAVLLKSGGNCAKCGVKLGDVFDVDHILPLAHAGSNTTENLQALCKPCHRDKTDDDIGRIAKGNRQSKMGEPKPESRIKSAPFRKDITKRFDGSVVPRKDRGQVMARNASTRGRDQLPRAAQNPSSPLPGAESLMSDIESKIMGDPRAVEAPVSTPKRAAREAVRDLTRAERRLVKNGCISGSWSMSTVRNLERKGLFYLKISSPNGQCGFMELTPLGLDAQALIKARETGAPQ